VLGIDFAGMAISVPGTQTSTVIDFASSPLTVALTFSFENPEDR